MTPDELKKIATESSNQEYEQVMKSLKMEAEKGSLSCGFLKISDAVISRLQKESFVVNKIEELSKIFSENNNNYIVKFER